MNRDRYEIIASLLRTASRPKAYKGMLMRKSGVSFSQLSSFLRFLCGHQLMTEKGRFFETTEKGRDFLEAYRRIKGMLK